jgi:hypothetical protein
VRLWARLTANWPLKLTSLLLAILLWLVAAFEQPSTRLVRVQLQVEPPAGREVLEAPATAQALVVGPARELLKLSARALTLTKTIADTVTARDVTLGLAPADIVLPREVDAEIRDVQPREVTVELDSVFQRLVPVRALLRGGGDPVQAGEVSVTPSVVRVSGPVDAVRRIPAVSTVPFDLPAGTGVAELQVALDTSLGRGVHVAPTDVLVRLEREPAEARVLAGVPVQLPGAVAAEWAAGIDTVSVAIRGPAARLAALTTDSVLVYLRGATHGGRVPLTLLLPEGLAGRPRPDSITLTRRSAR